MPQSHFPQSLIYGYKKFLDTAFHAPDSHYARLAEEGQRPEVLIISCCDSRAAPETIFDTKPGEVFVVRNIANQVPPFQPDGNYHSTSAALEYAVEGLGVKHIVILGHAKCSGVSSALEGKPMSSSDFIGRWMRLLTPAADEIVQATHLTENERQQALERISIRYSLGNLRTFPWIKEKEQKGQISLHGAWFDISTGELWVMAPETGDFIRCV